MNPKTIGATSPCGDLMIMRPPHVQGSGGWTTTQVERLLENPTSFCWNNFSVIIPALLRILLQKMCC